MTQVPEGFDFSFLNDEEARQILQVLERNEELQRAEKDRISKLQKTKRDIRWLQGVTGEWFEEIQRKKFRNDTDVNQMLKQPLTYRLRKTKNDSMHLPMSRSPNLPNRNNPSSTRRLGFRSSLASLFSFRKSGKEIIKPQPSSQQGYDGFPRTSVAVKGTPEAGIYNPSLNSESSNKVFPSKPVRMREGSGLSPWEASQLENEFFNVLDDLDNKLAQEQALSSANTRTPIHCGLRAQIRPFYTTRSRNGSLMVGHRNNYGETSTSSIYDILRPSTPREGFKTFSYRTKTIYDIYGTREHTVSQEKYVHKTFGSSSLCSDRIQPSVSPTLGHFTANSLHLPSHTQRKSVFVPRSHQQSPRRTPLSSIVWNRPHSPGDIQDQEEFPRAQSPIEVDPIHQDTYPTWPQDNRRYEFYRSSNPYESIRPHAPGNRATSPESLENSENMPLHQHENKFSRLSYWNTVGPRGPKKFGGSPFQSKKEESPSLSNFYQRNKEFISPDRDFEMISTDVNEGSAVHNNNTSVPYQSWRANFFRNQEESIHREFNLQTCVSEDMEILSQDNSNQAVLNQRYEHLHTPSMDTTENKFWTAPDIYSQSQVRPGMLVTQSKWPPMEANANSEPNLLKTTQNLSSSAQNSPPLILQKTEIPQSSNNQNTATRLWDTKGVTPDESASLPLRSQIEPIETNGDSVSVARNQPNTGIPELNPEKDLTESVSEKVRQVNEVNETGQADKMLPVVSQSLITETIPDYQQCLSKDSATFSSNKFVFNASVSRGSKKPSGVFGRRDISKIYISNRDKANALKKEDSIPERKPDLGISFPSSQENRTSLSFPKQNQSCQQEPGINNAGIEKEEWKLGTANNQTLKYPGESFLLDSEDIKLKNASVPPVNCIKIAENQVLSDHSLESSPDDGQGPPSSFSPNSPSLASLVTHSATSLNSTCNTLVEEKMFSKKSLLGKDPSQGESEKNTYSGNKNQYNQLSLSPSENQATGDMQGLDHHKVKDADKYHPNHPFSLGRGKGQIRRRVSCIEELSKSGSFLRQENNDSSDIVPDQSNSKSFEPVAIYCTFPRKLTSFLINDNMKSEKKIMSTSFRKGPPPFQIKNMEDPLEKCFSNKNNSNSSEPDRQCPLDSSPLRPTPVEMMTNIRNIAPTTSRKGPPPFEIKRTLSRPFITCSSGRVDRRDISYDLETEPSILTPRPEELISTTQENSPSIKDCSLQLAKDHPHAESFQIHSENQSKIASSQIDNFVSTFSLPDEKYSSFPTDVSVKQSGKHLHKYKTTSTVTVSGDEDNVKCLEVVSIYYTLPRKSNKKLCDLLKSDPQSICFSPESTTVGDATLPISPGKKKLNSSSKSLPGTPKSPHASVSSIQWRKHSFSHDIETASALQSPHSPYTGAEKPSAETLQGMDFRFSQLVEGISLCKEEFNTTKNDSAKTVSDDLQSKNTDTFSFIPGHQKEQEKWQKHTRHSSDSPTMLCDKLLKEGKLENSEKSIKVYERESPVIHSHLGDDASDRPCIGEILGKHGHHINIMSIGSGNCPREEVNDKIHSLPAAISFYDDLRELQPEAANGKLKTDDQKIIEKTYSALQSKDLSLPSNSLKLQPEEFYCKSESDLERSLREPKEISQGSVADKGLIMLDKVEDAQDTKAKEKMQGLACDQYSPPKIANEIKNDLGCTKEKNLEKRKNRTSVKQKLAALSKVSRKFSTKDMNSRKHIATIFPQEKVNSNTSGLSISKPEMSPLSDDSTLRIPESTQEYKKLGPRKTENFAFQTDKLSKTETPPQPHLDSTQKLVTYESEQKTKINNSKPNKNQVENVTKSPLSTTNSEDEILSEKGKYPQTLGTGYETIAPSMLSNVGREDFSDDLKRLSLRFPFETKISEERLLPPSSLSQRRKISPQEWEPDSNLYRSKSLKNINVLSNQQEISQPQKIRERHFSARTFSDNAQDRWKLGNEVQSGYGRRFRSFSELSGCDENDSWGLGSDRTRAPGPRSTSSISRPMDYGIFGKEQQLAFLENVKRSLTEGRLWRPNFLKNPGFLTNDVSHPANRPESLTSSSPDSKIPKDSLSPKGLLNIYQDELEVHSESDTDTTTDDEYYLDEADKESEL